MMRLLKLFADRNPEAAPCWVFVSAKSFPSIAAVADDVGEAPHEED